MLNMKLFVMICLGHLFCALSFSYANDNYLSSNQIHESIEFLKGPPKFGTWDFDQELKTLKSGQIKRISIQCEAIQLEAPLHMPLPFLQPLGPLTEEELEIWREFANKIYLEIKPILKGTKNKWRRPRPYLVDASLKPCIEKEETNSYPSSHAVMGQLFGKIFSFAYPSRAQYFLNRGNQYGLNRILTGIHYPSDVTDGQSLGDHIFMELMQNENFRKKIRELQNFAVPKIENVNLEN